MWLLLRVHLKFYSRAPNWAFSERSRQKSHSAQGSLGTCSEQLIPFVCSLLCYLYGLPQWRWGLVWGQHLPSLGSLYREMLHLCIPAYDDVQTRVWTASTLQDSVGVELRGRNPQWVGKQPLCSCCGGSPHMIQMQQCVFCVWFLLSFVVLWRSNCQDWNTFKVRGGTLFHPCLLCGTTATTKIISISVTSPGTCLCLCIMKILKV